MSTSSGDATARIGIVTVSDRASRGEYEDLSGPAITEYLSQVLTSPWEPVARVIADEQSLLPDTREPHDGVASSPGRHRAYD